MSKKISNIEKQIRFIRVARLLTIISIFLSFLLEFLVISFISAYQENNYVLNTDFHKKETISEKVVHIAQDIKITITKELQDFWNFIKEKKEDKNHNKTDNSSYYAFNVFCNDKFLFEVNISFVLLDKKFKCFYQPPSYQECLSDIFHPPKILS